MTVRMLRMITGEDLIAETHYKDADTAVLKNPIAAIAMGMQPNGKPQIGFAPWPPFTTDKEIRVDRRHIIAETTPLNEFLDEYRRMTSPIMTPSAQKLIVPN